MWFASKKKNRRWSFGVKIKPCRYCSSLSILAQEAVLCQVQWVCHVVKKCLIHFMYLHCIFIQKFPTFFHPKSKYICYNSIYFWVRLSSLEKSCNGLCLKSFITCLMMCPLTFLFSKENWVGNTSRILDFDYIFLGRILI